MIKQNQFFIHKVKTFKVLKLFFAMLKFLVTVSIGKLTLLNFQNLKQNPHSHCNFYKFREFCKLGNRAIL